MTAGEEGPLPYKWERVLFERRAWGWVFRSPMNWWPLWLGPARYYLVNDAQKAEIESAMGEMRRRRLLRAAAFLVGAIPLSVLYWKLTWLSVGYGLPLELPMITFVLLL